MASRIEKTILQITSAVDGWQAVFDNGDGNLGLTRVVCFALIEEVEVDDSGSPYGTPLRSIVPMVTFDDTVIDDATSMNNFVRIERCNQDERWREVAIDANPVHAP